MSQTPGPIEATLKRLVATMLDVDAPFPPKEEWDRITQFCLDRDFPCDVGTLVDGHVFYIGPEGRLDFLMFRPIQHIDD